MSYIYKINKRTTHDGITSWLEWEGEALVARAERVAPDGMKAINQRQLVPSREQILTFVPPYDRPYTTPEVFARLAAERRVRALWEKQAEEEARALSHNGGVVMPKLDVAVVADKVLTRNNAPGEVMAREVMAREVMAREYLRDALVLETDKYLGGNLDDFLTVDDFLTECEAALGDKMLRAEVYLLTKKELQEYIDQALYGRDDG